MANGSPAAINQAEQRASFSDHWNPPIVALCNGKFTRAMLEAI